MRRPPTRVVVLVAAVALVVVVGGLYAVRWWSERDRTELDRALAMSPGDTQRWSWTDWAGVRDELGVEATTDAGAGGVDRTEALLDRGFDADLTSTSALVESAPDLQARYGFSPLSARWEMFSQSPQGMAVVVGLDPDQVDGVADALRALGFAEPSSADGVWEAPETGGEAGEVIASVTPELLNVVLDADRGLVLGSDTSAQLERAAAAAGVGGDDPDADAAPAPVREAAGRLGEPLSAALYTGDQACRELAMGQADEREQARGEALVAAAGPVSPLTAFAMGARAGGDVRVAMTFDSPDQARTNADTRATLAAGDAPGQGGTFPDRFTLGRVVADGDAVTMDLAPTEGSYVLSDLSTGPLLFATC